MIAVTSACLTDPPPDLPLGSQPPTILREQMQPPEGTITSLPTDGFFVAVQLADPTDTCWYSVYDEYQTYVCRPCPTASSAGIVPVNFFLTGLFDPDACHRISFAVASSFPNAACTIGSSDVVDWEYDPPSCLAYDAGAVADGAFPAEAATDALPLVPDSGDEP